MLLKVPLLPLQSSIFFIVRAVDLVIFGSMFFFTIFAT